MSEPRVVRFVVTDSAGINKSVEFTRELREVSYACTVGHEAVVGWTSAKCPEMLPSGAMCACSCHFPGDHVDYEMRSINR